MSVVFLRYSTHVLRALFRSVQQAIEDTWGEDQAHLSSFVATCLGHHKLVVLGAETR
jgi:hypothetical protein